MGLVGGGYCSSGSVVDEDLSVRVSERFCRRREITTLKFGEMWGRSCGRSEWAIGSWEGAVGLEGMRREIPMSIYGSCEADSRERKRPRRHRCALCAKRRGTIA